MWTKEDKDDFYHKTAGRINSAICGIKILEIPEDKRANLSDEIDEARSTNEALINSINQRKYLFETWIELALEKYNEFPDNYSKKELRESLKISKEMDWFDRQKLKGFLNWFRASVYY
ncbi:MAG: hypothetical protein PVJ67_06680 [Candidatus Pacearchaeota archaeon]|jgi:hypothetical protein